MSSPAGWTEATLGKECSIEIGGTPSRGVSEYWDADGLTENVWVSIKDMRVRLITDTAERISNLGVRHSNVKLQPEGTVLLSFKLTIGRVAFAGVPLYTNEAIAGLQSKALDSDYLYHGLQQWDLLQGVDQAIKGATLNKAKLKKISFVCPKSRAEQSKIAEVLSTVDRAIAQTEALIAKQQRIKTGLIQDLLTRGIDEHGQLRTEATHAFKDSPLGRIPAEWECDCLSAHISSIEQGWSPDCEVDRAAFGHWGVLKTTAVTWEGYNDIENKGLPEDLKPRTQHEVQTDDLLMTRAGPNSRVGVVAHVRATQPKLMLSDKLYRLRNKDSVDPEYLALTLASVWTQRHLSTLKTGLAESQTNISQDIVRSLLIKVPRANEQTRIVSALREIDDQLVSERAFHKKLHSLKTALMQDLLTGKVRVTPLLQQAQEVVNT